MDNFVSGAWNAICSKCGENKPQTEYYIHSNGKPRKYCVSCHYKNGVVYRKANPVEYDGPTEKKRIACRKWRKKNLSYDAMRTRERNAIQKKAMPLWADRKKIKEIYKNCPSGYHVDHIVPLRGNLVSGLHNEFNLQYLSAIENIRKKNYYVI